MSEDTGTNVNTDTEFKQQLGSLYAYLAKNLQIRETPKVVITKNAENAEDPFGKTGYYDPATKTIRLYTTDRHNTDILRSFAHEVIHHWQNERGTLQPQSAQVDGHYAQSDGNLRKREMEAYLFGNILFRDWQDEQRYGPPQTPPALPQPLDENLKVQNSQRLKDGLKRLLQTFINDGTISAYHSERTTGDMNPQDFIEDFANKLVSSLNRDVQTIDNRGAYE